MQSDPFGGGGAGEPEMWIGGAIGCVMILFALAMTVLMIVAYWKIFAKAGFSGALALLLLVPIANFIIILYLAFAEWPIHRELESYRYGDTGAPPPPPGAP